MIRYTNGWTVESNPDSLCRATDFTFYHEDECGSGELSGTASSYNDAIDQIKEIEGVE